MEQLPTTEWIQEVEQRMEQLPKSDVEVINMPLPSSQFIYPAFPSKPAELSLRKIG